MSNCTTFSVLLVRRLHGGEWRNLLYGIYECPPHIKLDVCCTIPFFGCVFHFFPFLSCFALPRCILCNIFVCALPFAASTSTLWRVCLLEGVSLYAMEIGLCPIFGVKLDALATLMVVFVTQPIQPPLPHTYVIYCQVWHINCNRSWVSLADVIICWLSQHVKW